MLFRKYRFLKSKKETETDFALQITSLADILMIVLIFLLKAVSSGLTDQQSINVSSQIRLPAAESGGGVKEGLKVEISQNMVLVGGQPVSKLLSFRFDSGDLNADLTEGGTSKTLDRFFAQLRAENRHQRKPSSEDKDKDKDKDENSGDTVWIVADRQAPYATIQTVIASAAKEGYSDFKLAVVKGD